MTAVEAADSAEAPQASDAGRYDAFLSYAREDSDFVIDRLRVGLRGRGHEVWVDVDITGGAKWHERVLRGIEACKAFVFVISRASVSSVACQQELEDAVALNKLIIPVVYRDNYQDPLPAALAESEWVFLRDRDDPAVGMDRLVEALETDLEWRDEHTRLAGRAREWLDSSRDNSYLLRGSDLRDAEAWLAQQAGHREAPTREHSEYIARSRQAAARRLSALVAALTLGLAIAIGLLIFALIQRSTARRQATVATSRQLAAVSENEQASNLDLALLLAVRAYRTDANPETLSALLRANLFSPNLVRYLPMGGQVATLAGSGNGTTVVAGLADGRVMRQPLNAHGPSLIASLGGAVTSVAANSDGGTVAAANGSRGVLWRPGVGASQLHCPAPETPGRVGVSPSGRTVAVYCASPGGQAQSSVALTNGLTGALRAVHPQPLNSDFAGFSGASPGELILPSDNALLMFGGGGKWQWRSLPSWSLSGSSSGAFGAHQGTPSSSSDGRYVTVTNGAPTIPVWPTSAPTTFDPTTAPFTAQAPISAPTTLTLSPHGDELAVADSGTVYVARIASATKPHPSAVQLTGNGSINPGYNGSVSVHTLTFLGDSSHLVSASGDMIAVWDLNQLSRVATLQPSSALASPCNACAGALTAISPNARQVAAVADNGTLAVVQRLDGRHAPRVLRGSDFGPPVWDGTQLLLPLVGSSRPTGPMLGIRAWRAVPDNDSIAAAALSRDGHFVTIVNGSGNVYLEEPDTGHVEWRISGPRDLAQKTAYLTPGMAAVDTRDGRVAIIDNGRTYLYDLSSRSIVGHLAGTNASYLAFAGDRLLVQRSDGNVEIWDQRGAALERTLPADQSYAGFYPVTDAGGHLVARQRSDGSTTIADLDSGATLATLPAPASPQLGLKIGSAFGPDGQHLVTVLETLTTNGSWIIQYDLRPATLVRAACSAAGRNLTAADWRAYVGSTSPSDLSCR